MTQTPAIPVEPTPAAIERAADLLRQGRLVAFPTETVYGLGANAADPAAVGRIFAAKGRPADHPLIVHLPEPDHADAWARDIPPEARLLMERFWPGPLTLILKRGRAPLEVTGGQDSVGLRMPDHPVARSLLSAFNGGLAAPSANRFGRVSPTTAEHVREELGDRVDLILDGGSCQVGVESTILSLLGPEPMVMRPGAIGFAELEGALCRPVARFSRSALPTVRASGMLESHYAPMTSLELVAAHELAARAEEGVNKGLRIAVLIRGLEADFANANAVTVIPMPADAAGFARCLYAALRQADDGGFDRLLMEAPPDGPEWLAVTDRLERASHRG